VAHREFVDTHEVQWQVWEVVPSSAERRDAPERRSQARTEVGRRVRQELRIRMESELAQGWLVFESASEKRRLRPIPEGWDQLDDNGLVRLLNDAAPAPRTTRRLIE
jgi:hypothetical protein